MAVPNIYSQYAVKVDVGNEVVIGGITSQTVTLGSEHRANPISGTPYPEHMALALQNPTATADTTEIAKALDKLTVSGLEVTSDDPDVGVVFYAVKHDPGGTRATTSINSSYTFGDGLLVPRTITAAHQQDASLSFEMLPISDGTNAPIADSIVAALPTIGTQERFTLGPVTLGSKVLTGIQSVDIDFGITATPRGSDSDMWNTHISSDMVVPTITIRGVNLEWFGSATIPLAGLVGTTANTSIYLRKYSDGGSYVADGTAEHIKFQSDGVASIGSVNASGPEATIDVTFQCLATAFNTHPITLDTASTIT